MPMNEDLSFNYSHSKWRKFIDSFNELVQKGKFGEKKPHPDQGLKLIDVNGKDQSWSLALQIYSGVKKYEYYIKIKWNSKGNKYLVSKNLMPYGVDVQKLLQDHTLEKFEDVENLVEDVFLSCCAFHNRQRQIQDLKDLLKQRHWRMELFYSHTLLYMRIGFYPLGSNKESPSKEREHIYIELHYEQDQIRPTKITLDCTGYSDEDMEVLKLQFSVLKKYALAAALEFALVKEEVQENDDGDGNVSSKEELVSTNEGESSSESAVAGPSGTQQQQAKSPSVAASSSSSS